MTPGFVAQNERIAMNSSTRLTGGHNMKNQESPMSKNELLVDVAKILKGARSLAETCSERTLLYLIDMAICEACEALASTPNG
jgi:hypothetical protein